MSPHKINKYLNSYLVTLDDGEWRPTLRHAALLQDIVHGLAKAVVAAEAPILFMHYPAAPFGNPTHGGAVGLGGVRPPLASCIRMSVAIDESDSAKRIALVRSIHDLSRRAGLGLQVGDRKTGSVRGEWRPLRERDETTFEVNLNSRHSSVSNSPVRSVVPVTVVGPARVGSTLSVVRRLKDHGVGVVGVGITAMQEVAFINLMVACRSEAEVPTGSLSRPLGHDVPDGLKEIIMVARGWTPDQLRKNAEGLDSAERASGYRILASGRQTFSTALAERPSFALWVFWDVPEVVGYAALLVSLRRAARDLVDSRSRRLLNHHVIEYARGRALDNDRFRGRAKISVVLAETDPGRDVKERLDDVAEALEDAVRHDLIETFPVQRDITLRVEWRERWLGAWSLPI